MRHAGGKVGGRLRLRSAGPALVVVLALLVAACGESATGELTAAQEPAPEGAGEPEGAEGPDPAADDPLPEELQEPEPPAPEAEQEPSGPSPSECDLATLAQGPPLEVSEYERLTLEVNFELELLVMDVAADLDELQSGASEEAELRGRLDDQKVAYAAAVHPLAGVGPPAGAEGWHDQAVASFERVCEALSDGIQGLEGAGDSFERFVAALTEFPALINDLHANAACGPTETGC